MKSKHEKQILSYLAKQNQFVTSDQISSELEISTKTVYRVVKKINDSQGGRKLIISEKGKGYKLDYDNYIKYIGEVHPRSNNYSPVERRNRVIEKLLLKSPQPININNLYDEYYVSDTVIFNDEKVIYEILEQFNLEYVRKNKLVSIVGEEENVRKAISSVVSELESIDYNLFRINDNLTINNTDMSFVLEQLSIIESATHTEIPHPYDINIFTHLYVMIGRVRKSTNILKKNDLFPNEFERRIIAENEEIYIIAKQVLDNIEKYVEQTLSSEETYYLFQYLLSSRLKTNDTIDNKISPLISSITNMYMERIEESSLLENNQSIYYELYQHIKPMVNRLKNGINIRNKLIDSIKSEYPQIYNEVELVSKLVSEKYELPKISDDENGFITLYFARMLEQSGKKIKTLITCTTGVGTSELLKVKVNKKFPNIDVIEVVSLREVESSINKHNDIDLIITTINLAEPLHIPVVVVSAMFTNVDQKRVAEKLEVIQYAK